MVSKELSIVTVNYKTPKLLHTCISSIYKFTNGLSFEVIVIDNNSEDESEELIMNEFIDVKWVNSGFNAGTSIAYNLGVKHSSGKYILILNSDTEFIENTIKITLDYYKKLETETKVGMLGCQLKGYDSLIQYNSYLSFIGFRRFLRGNPISIKLNLFQYKLSDEENLKLHQKNHESMWLGIAYGLINGKLFKEDNLYFDEDIFMYCDDVEWCYRASKYGYKHFFLSETTILHWNGGSAGGNFSGWRHGQILISDWLGLVKMYGKIYFLFCMFIFRFNFLLDDLFYLVNKEKRNKSIKELREFEKKIFKKYFPIILFKYSKRNSSTKKFLKFEML